MAKSSDDELTPFGKVLAVVGFFAGFSTVWQNNEEFWPAFITGILVAVIGGFVGNILWRLFIVAIALAIAVGTFYVRQEVTHAVIEGVRSSQVSPPSTSTYSDSESGWTICNKSNESKVYVAYNYKDGIGWVKKGWRNIEKGECSLIIEKLTTQYVYYYAEGGDSKWTGNKNFCAHPTKKFTHRSKTCAGEYKIYPFKEVDTGDNLSWKTNLVE